LPPPLLPCLVCLRGGIKYPITLKFACIHKKIDSWTLVPNSVNYSMCMFTMVTKKR
jgi:hypothetical protein